MIEPFPNLVDDQVVLARALYSTGHVVDNEYNLVVSEAQKVFTIYQNKEFALIAAKNIVQNRPDVECWIQGKDEKLINYIHTANLESFM